MAQMISSSTSTSQRDADIFGKLMACIKDVWYSVCTSRLRMVSDALPEGTEFRIQIQLVWSRWE
jgi:hypothetical protein